MTATEPDIVQTVSSPSVPLAIEATELRKTYPKGVRALDGLTIAVPRGAIFALLGPNGAGKSTTVKILTTLARADSGTARVAGLDVLREARLVRHLIGCVSQKSTVDAESTGRENLTLQGQFYGLRGAELKRRVTNLLDRFGLSDAAHRVARTYSGGMQRKLDVAMALIHRPQVLFLDEPTTGLDPEARANLWAEIARLNSEGLTILLTTHYLEEADQLAREVAIVDRGRIVAQGAPEDLKAELRGDSVQVELAAPAALSEVEAALSGVGTVREVQVSDSVLYARADHGASAVPAILSALEAAGFRAAAVRVARPTLDDVYLRHTGRTIEQAEKGESK